jgi:hypothetical protein
VSQQSADAQQRAHKTKPRWPSHRAANTFCSSAVSFYKEEKNSTIVSLAERREKERKERKGHGSQKLSTKQTGTVLSSINALSDNTLASEPWRLSLRGQGSR